MVQPVEVLNQRGDVVRLVEMVNIIRRSSGSRQSARDEAISVNTGMLNTD